MDMPDLADCLGTLGNTTRLSIFALLVKAGPDGLTVGEIQQVLRVPGSTLSHHIFSLASSALIIQAREGRTLRCRPNFPRMRAIVDALTAECCKGVRIPDAGGAKHRRARKAA